MRGNSWDSFIQGTVYDIIIQDTVTSLLWHIEHKIPMSMLLLISFVPRTSLVGVGGPGRPGDTGVVETRASIIGSDGGPGQRKGQGQRGTEGVGSSVTLY